MAEKIVVIGDGIAAVTAIKAMREVEQESEIYVFGEEKFYPYNRIRLSKGLLETLEEEKILLLKKEWYDENNVNIEPATAVNEINLTSRELTLSDGRKVPYTKLLIATGAANWRPPIPGIDKAGVCTLRTLADAWNIMTAMQTSKKVLLIGGGIQGLETAWILANSGQVEVTLVELLERLMPKQLDEKASRILERAVRSYKINVKLETQIAEFLGDSKVTGVRTKDGKTIDCDMVIYSTGIVPNLKIVEGTGIKTNKGILVDKRMETNIPGVFAAGDVAELSGVYGLWNIAIAQGKVAGYNIVGKESIYEPITPVTTLSAFELPLFSMGVVDMNEATDVVIDKNLSEWEYQKVLLKDNRVIGAIIIGDIRKSPVLKTAIERETLISDVDYQNVSVDELIEILKSEQTIK